MKILMLVLQFPPAPSGGAEMQCWKQARALAARGHEVSIWTKWLMPGSSRRERRDGVEIRRLGFLYPVRILAQRLGNRWRPKSNPAAPAGSRVAPMPGDEPGVAIPARKFRFRAPIEWLGQASFLLEAAWAVKAGGFCADVIHVHESQWLAGFGQWLGERMGAPVFCKEASEKVLLWTGGQDVPWLERWRKRRLDCRFIAMTPHIRRELEQAGIAPARIVEVPNGVVVPAAVARPEAQATAVYGGNFTQGAVYKAFDVLLKAWGLAVRQEPGMRLKLYGGGDARRWQQVAEQEGCGATVEFAGQTDDLPGKFLESGFLVLPSRVEGLSNVLLEAQAAGLPAVVSDIGGNRTVVRDGENGLVVPVGDAAALAKALVKLYRAPELRARMGRAARRRAEEVFAIGLIAERLEQAYQQAVSGTAAANSAPAG